MLDSVAKVLVWLLAQAERPLTADQLRHEWHVHADTLLREETVERILACLLRHPDMFAYADGRWSLEPASPDQPEDPLTPPAVASLGTSCPVADDAAEGDESSVWESLEREPPQPLSRLSDFIEYGASFDAIAYSVTVLHENPKSLFVMLQTRYELPDDRVNYLELRLLLSLYVRSWRLEARGADDIALDPELVADLESLHVDDQVIPQPEAL